MDPLLQKTLITTKEAGELFGYSSDYLARLARSGKIVGRRVGHSWLVEREPLELFVANAGDRKIDRARALALARAEEYRSHRTAYRTLVSRVHKVLRPIEISSDSGLPQGTFLFTQHRHVLQLSATTLALLVVISGALIARAGAIQNAGARLGE